MVGIWTGLEQMVEVLVEEEAEHRCNQNATVGLRKIRRIFTISKLADRDICVGVIILEGPNRTSITTIVDRRCRRSREDWAVSRTKASLPSPIGKATLDNSENSFGLHWVGDKTLQLRTLANNMCG